MGNGVGMQVIYGVQLTTHVLKTRGRSPGCCLSVQSARPGGPRPLCQHASLPLPLLLTFKLLRGVLPSFTFKVILFFIVTPNIFFNI